MLLWPRTVAIFLHLLSGGTSAPGSDVGYEQPFLRYRNGSLDWNAQLADKIAGMPSRTAKAKELYGGPIGRWVDRYRGGVPAGFAIAAITYESGGNPGTVGDQSLGEYGLMQLTARFPPTVGMPAESRFDPETNVFLGLLQLQLAAITLAREEPMVELGSADAWKLARLGFSIGMGGTRSLMQLARPYMRKGHVFGAIKDYVAAHGGIQAGSQEPGKVAYRVAMIDVVWTVGQNVVRGGGGMPRRPPAPPRFAYQIPPALEPYFHLRSGSATLAVAVIAVASWYLYKRLAR